MDDVYYDTRDFGLLAHRLTHPSHGVDNLYFETTSVPSRDPQKYPVCPECKETWEKMQGDKDGA